MAIKVDWSNYSDRERKAKFTNSLTPESPYKSAGVSVLEVKKLAKTFDSDDIEINYIEDVLLKGFIIAFKKESFSEKGIMSFTSTGIAAMFEWFDRYYYRHFFPDMKRNLTK